MKKTDWAYIAGYVDGEGHFGNRITSNNFIRVDFVIQSCDLKTLKWIRDVTGLGVYRDARDKTVLNKPQGRYHVHRKKELVKFIKGVMPYIKNKKQQAVLVLEVASIPNLAGKYCHYPERNPYRKRVHEINAELMKLKDSRHYRNNLLKP